MNGRPVTRERNGEDLVARELVAPEVEALACEAWNLYARGAMNPDARAQPLRSITSNNTTPGCLSPQCGFVSFPARVGRGYPMDLTERKLARVVEVAEQVSLNSLHRTCITLDL